MRVRILGCQTWLFSSAMPLEGLCDELLRAISCEVRRLYKMPQKWGRPLDHGTDLEDTHWETLPSAKCPDDDSRRPVRRPCKENRLGAGTLPSGMTRTL